MTVCKIIILLNLIFIRLSCFVLLGLIESSAMIAYFSKLSELREKPTARFYPWINLDKNRGLVLFQRGMVLSVLNDFFKLGS